MTKAEAEALLARYTTRVTSVSNAPRGWNYLDVEILFDGERIGSYRRNYPNLYTTFRPFLSPDRQGAFQTLALYSPHYTATRLLLLPECADIGGEEPHSNGFCPTNFLVPYDPARGLTGQFGFVSGCIWGDDSSWKIEYLDLTDAARGVIRRDARFGYLELPRRLRLTEAIDLSGYRGDDEYGEIEFTVSRTYFLRTSKYARSADGGWAEDEEEPTPP